MIKNNSPKVLVAYIFTQDNRIFDFVAKKDYQNLKYKNKLAVFCYPESFFKETAQKQGENKAAALRALVVAYAKEQNVDWILFVSPNLELENDTIEKLMATKRPFVGAMICPSLNDSNINAWNYENRKNLKIRWLRGANLAGDRYVEHVPDELMFVAKGIYEKVDFLNYKPITTDVVRNITVDEWLQLEYYKKFKLYPYLCTECRPWYRSQNGQAYKFKSDIKIWMKK